MLGFIDSRLRNVNLLEPSNHTLRTREVTVIFLVGRRADKADGACFQIGFQHVRGVHGSLASGTGSHQCMYLVDIDDVVVALLLHAIHNHLDAVFEVATILRASHQRSHVKLVYLAAHQSFGHLSFFYHPCQSPHEGCLAHARLSHVQRIVLVSTWCVAVPARDRSADSVSDTGRSCRLPVSSMLHQAFVHPYPFPTGRLSHSR